MSFELPVYLEQPGEHPEVRERVGTCKVSLPESPMTALLKGEMTFEPGFEWLKDAIDGMDVGTGFGPNEGTTVIVLRPPTHIGGEGRLA